MSIKATSSKHALRKFIAWITLSFALCFMVCLFTPLEAYFTNPGEFWYDFSLLLPMLLIVFGVFFLLSFIPYILFRNFRVFGYIFTFAFFSYLGLYVQGNLVPRPYGVFDGKSINWGGSEYSKLSYISIAILISVILLTVISIFLLHGRIYRIAPIICTGLVVVQLSTLFLVTYINYHALTENEHKLAVTNDRMFSLSKKRNFIIFLLDTFEASTMTDLLNTPYGDTIRSSLPGFTFYPDTVGCYPNTTGALPYMLEGQWYNNEKPLTEFIQDAYAAHPPMYDALQKADYTIGLYQENTRRLSNDYKLYINVKPIKYIISDYKDFFKNVYKMALFNYVPHQLKSHFLVYSGNFDRLRKLEGDYTAYDSTVETLYKQYKDFGLTFTEEKNAFRYYYTEGVHQSYTFDVNIKPGINLTHYDEAKGCLTFLREYIEELQNAGAYDNTAIIVYADHSDGWRVNRGSNPLFMVKPFNDNMPFEVSDLAVSYEDLQATYSSIALETILPGSIWSDEIKSRTERRFLWYQPGGGMERKAFLPNMREYAVRGFAGDPDSMHLTGNFYEPDHAYHDDHYYAYTLGTILHSDKSMSNSAARYYDYGIDGTGNQRSYSRDYASQFCFDLQVQRGNLLFTMDYELYFEDVPQRVMISVNGTSLGELHSNEPVFIPENLIASDGMVRIRLDYPDAITDLEHNLKFSHDNAQGTYLRSILFNTFLLDRAE